MKLSNVPSTLVKELVNCPLGITFSVYVYYLCLISNDERFSDVFLVICTLHSYAYPGMDTERTSLLQTKLKGHFPEW